MDANGFSVVDNHVGITFGVELHIPWDAPEAVVDISSAGVVPLRNVPDVIGLVGRRESAVESRVRPFLFNFLFSVRARVPFRYIPKKKQTDK